MAANTVFALTSGRSGTRFLYELLRKNAPDCTVVHEPYFQPGNPTMFGLPIYDLATGNPDAIRKLVMQKYEAVQRCPSELYIETSHAFLKSYWDIAPEFFPKMKVLHLIRNPLEVARSEANREAFIDRWRLPFRRYRGRDGGRYFRWALTGLEPIFGNFRLENLSPFQRYLVQWIEIENRAMAFLGRFGKKDACMTLHTPFDLKDPRRIVELLCFLGREAASERVVFPRGQNRTPGSPTVIGKEELDQCRAVIETLPARYLGIFREAPYTDYPWSRLLWKSTR
ncbi:MAG: hypothetical protein ACU826_04300 [Gammaproteobacteria bacterium]